MINKIVSRQLPVRIGLIVAVIFALVFAWFSIRWQLGNMLAELTQPTEANAKEIALLANRLSPSDPSTNWLIASTEKDVFTPEKIEESLKGFTRTVQLAPYDYRWWVELGRAFEQADQPESAEKAYRRAVDLAPEYTYPHWQLGNFYLRQDRSEEAFVELKKAAEDNTVYRQQVFSIAWDFYEQDTAKLEEIAGDISALKTDLAKFYAIKGRAEDSLRIWNTLSEEEKLDRNNELIARLIARVLYDKRFFRTAIGFVSQSRLEPQAKLETVQNGGFEEQIGETENVYFDWKIEPVEKMDVKLDPTHKHSGNRSLRVTFNGFSELQLSNIFQMLAVQGNTKYRLSFWLKTEDLKSAGTPTLEIVDASADKIITVTKPFPTGTNNWQQINLDFTTPETTEAVLLRTTRAYCGERCPIVGTFWYDDFQLTKQ